MSFAKFFASFQRGDKKVISFNVAAIEILYGDLEKYF
jgi:hypothetical protein